MESKLRKCFDEMVVYKDLKKTNFFSSLSLPSFLRDWLLHQFQDEEGRFDVNEIADFIKTYLPPKSEWLSIKNRIVFENERVKLLTKISVDIDIKTQAISFSLPEYGLAHKETIIEPYVWETCKEYLIRGNETWGIVELGYQFPDEDTKQKGRIKLTDFQDFCPYIIDLDFFKKMRAEFTLSEWIDVLLGAIDYNASHYEHDFQKTTMLTRLLPFVEKRLNLIELAPKGTGKSYLFGRISKFGWLSSGGIMSRAKMFYDISKRTPGLVNGNDFIALDEVQTISFSDVDEMRAALKGYMESGIYTVGNYEGTAESGIILLGNISQSNQNENANMFAELPAIFHESALIDRFHGFIKGWNIPRMNDDLKMSGWALNSEYFCTILHMLRDDTSYRAIVDAVVEVPPRADTRDTEAVKRIATAYLKLLFPHVQTPEDINPFEFLIYCLRPACEMRQTIKTQLEILDSEFRGKDVPVFNVKEVRHE